MQVEITPRDRLVIECLLTAWDENGCGLYGALSYRDVLNFCEKLELPHPPELTKFLNENSNG